jgi:hypothetical protein
MDENSKKGGLVAMFVTNMDAVSKKNDRSQKEYNAGITTEGSNTKESKQGKTKRSTSNVIYKKIGHYANN